MKTRTVVTLAAVTLTAFAGVAIHSIATQSESMVRAVRPAKHNKQHAERACREFTKNAKPGDTSVVFGSSNAPHDLCIVHADGGATVIRMRYAENDNSRTLFEAGRAVIQ